jgi:hypothetical protein
MEFEPEIVVESEKWEVVRAYRTTLLRNSDWTQLPDARITLAKKLEWDAYRELLNTVEARYQNSNDVVIPSMPVDERTETSPSSVTYTVPVIATDFLVQSPKPKTDPLEALTEAIAEAGKTDKSIALIVLDLVKYLEDVEKRLKKAKV